MTTYLCGGINGLSDADCRDWREVAKAQLLTGTLDPMRRDYRGREDESVKEIVIGDLADINESDFVLVNATRPSWGTAMELFYAASKGKTVIGWVTPGPVSPWLRYFCTALHETLEGACDDINRRNKWVPPRKKLSDSGVKHISGNRFDCHTCGLGIAVDEDGCCRTCGADAVVVQA